MSFELVEGYSDSFIVWDENFSELFHVMEFEFNEYLTHGYIERYCAIEIGPWLVEVFWGTDDHCSNLGTFPDWSEEPDTVELAIMLKSGSSGIHNADLDMPWFRYITPSQFLRLIAVLEELPPTATNIRIGENENQGYTTEPNPCAEL